jgi:cytochrome c553
MRRFLRWIGIGLATVAALAIVAYAVVYVLSERVLRHPYPVPATALSIPSDAASLTEGKRLATIRGCFSGCHGREMEGSVMFDEPMIARVVAPNLRTHKYSDAELAGIIRSGVRPGGRSLVVMPAEVFNALNDDDLARIIAFIKSLQEVTNPLPGLSYGPIGRIGLVAGKFKLAAQLIAETVPVPEATNEQAAHGRYLARTTCAGCHGTSLKGNSTPAFASPDLRVVAAYPAEEFARLLRTGVALGGRKLGVMSAAAQGNLSQLTDGEIADLYSYLHAMPGS